MNVFVLDSTSKSIVAVLASGPLTQPDYVSSYADATSNTFTEVSSDGTLNGVTEVAVVAAPSANTRRIVREIVITNTNSAAVTLTVKFVNGANKRTIWTGILAVGYSWTLSGGVLVNPTQPADGWVDPGETWTYASATSITVPSDATAKYSVGDKIRIKQGGAYKYLYITAVAATTLTVTGGTDYSVANATITDNYYSKAASPVGFPSGFAYTPTVSGLTSPVYAVQQGKFTITAGRVQCWGNLNINSWSGQSGSILINLPVSIATTYGSLGTCTYYRTGTSTEQGTHSATPLSATQIGMVSNAASGAIAWEASAVVQFRWFIDVPLA